MNGLSDLIVPGLTIRRVDDWHRTTVLEVIGQSVIVMTTDFKGEWHIFDNARVEVERDLHETSAGYMSWVRDGVRHTSTVPLEFSVIPICLTEQQQQRLDVVRQFIASGLSNWAVNQFFNYIGAIPPEDIEAIEAVTHQRLIYQRYRRAIGNNP